MLKNIAVPLPVNVTTYELPLFESYQTYELSQQKVKKIKNVFVAHTGFCLNSKGLIKECHHNHPHQYADYQSETARYYYNVTDHPENLITFDDDRVYLSIHHPWFNYYHWIFG